MNILNQDINKIIPYINNPRNNENAVDKVAGSIKEFGFKVPIVVDGGNVIVTGLTRLLAAKKLGLKQVPTIVADDLTDAQIKAFRIADNKVNEFAEWDMDMLKVEMEQLQELDFDLSLTGFDECELDLDFGDDEQQEYDEDSDVIEEPPVNPYSKRGDVWLLGKHRLMCGSSTDEADVKVLVDGCKIDFIHTDPPYGMNAVSKSSVLKEKYGTDILGDDDNSVAINSFKISRKLSADNEVWWGANYYSECLPSSECWIVWDKNNGTSDQTDCELAWATFRSVVRKFTKASEKTNRVHPTQKPVDLVLWLFEKFSNKGKFDNVLDLFGGSGVTLIAADVSDKKSFTMEYDEKFVDVIVKRYMTHKGNGGEDVKLIREDCVLEFKDIQEEFYGEE